MGVTFDEVARYLEGLVGHRVEVYATPRAGDGGGDLCVAGVVTHVACMPLGPTSSPRGHRYFCQVGDEATNGFGVSSSAFVRAGLDLEYPEPPQYALFVVMNSHQLVITDERIYWAHGGPRLPAQR